MAAIDDDMRRFGEEMVRRPEVLAMGYDDNDLRRLKRAGGWEQLRPGAYVPSVDGARRWPEERHRLQVVATVPVAHDAAAASHQSAAVMHDLALWGTSLSTVHVTRSGVGGGHRRRWMHTHVSPLAQDEIVMVDGIPVTSIPRTLVDLARTAGFEQGVVAADDALHRNLVTAEQLRLACDRARRQTGIGIARRVVGFANGLAESPGESRSRVQMMRAGLPDPRLQVRIWSADGEYLGRVDFLFEELHTVGEFDGKVKYGRLLPPDVLARNAADEIGRIVFAEKVREDGIRGVPLSVARWVWDDLRRRAVTPRLTAAFTIGRTFAGAPTAGRIDPRQAA